MSADRGRLVRIILIDRILQTTDPLRSDKIFSIVNDKLLKMGIDPVKSVRTVEQDLEIFKNGIIYGYKFGQVLDPELIKKKPYQYRYSNPENSIFGLGLTGEEMLDVQELWNILDKMSYADSVGSIKDVLQKLLERNNQSRDKDEFYVKPDRNQGYTGMQNFKILFEAARLRKKVSFDYKSFEKGAKSQWIIFHPYILKEHRCRWFIVGFEEPKGKIKDAEVIGCMKTYGLERISGINAYNSSVMGGIVTELTDGDEFTVMSSFDRETFDQYTYGAHTDFGKEPTEIRLWLSELQANYARTMKIHPKQEIVKENKDGSIELKIEIYPNYEFYHDIRGWGKNMKVLSPKKVRDSVSMQ